ncbi:MAG: amidase [SAR324 cluster bacterium]|nr:amidase [SAR324 cluster bacterium]MBL7034808.1 amidase [SAR324 cluster bacterium]
MEIKKSKTRESTVRIKRFFASMWPFKKRAKPVYNLKTIRIPRTSGRLLKFLNFLLRTPGIRFFLLPLLLRQAGLPVLRKCGVDDAPVMHPVHPADSQITAAAAKKTIQQFRDSYETKQESGLVGKKSAAEKQSLFQPETAADFHRAYLEGKTTPVDVAMRLLDIIRSIEESAVPLRPFMAWDERDLMQQAKASAERFERGESLGILDGVPVAVKDELDMLPFPTMVGTKFYNTKSPAQDATSVERLRSAGALMVGKTNMHEIGLGVTGLNKSYGTTRNPHHLDHFPGGSSSGSAAAVAAGVCPISLGVDGGGSIRIPASLCGVVGLKTTWGRISTAGSAPLSWSLGTVGPITSTVRDAALAYSFLAGPDPRQINSQNQPSVDLQDFEDSNLSGVKLGVFSPWFEHASADIVQSCQQMLEAFKSQGATVEEIEVPDLDEIRMAQIVTIVTEMLTSLQTQFNPFRKPLGLDTILNLTLAKQFKATDYVKAQRVRARLMKNFQKIYQQVDAVVTPTTARTAPPILPDALKNGESDLGTLTELMRYAPGANLGGFPAISFPVGYDAQGLPVGMQLMGRPWEESLLLRLANTSERFFARHPPMMRFSLLPN